MTLCVHACWLQHAADEQAKRAPGESRPFLAIVQRLAERARAGHGALDRDAAPSGLALSSSGSHRAWPLPAASCSSVGHTASRSFSARSSWRTGSIRVPAAGADLVVALADASIRPAELAACVSPGGVVYREIDRRRPRERDDDARSVEARPRRFRAASALVSLGDPGVQSGAAVSSTRSPRCAAMVLRHPAPCRQRARARWPRPSPDCSFAGRRMVLRPWSRPSASRPWPDPRERVTGRTCRCSPRSCACRAAGSCMLTSGQDDGSRVVLLPFTAESHAPEAVVKISRTERFNAHTEREQATLAAIRSGLDADLVGSIPEPRGLTRFGRSVVALESYAPGASMVRSIGRRGEPLERSLEDLRIAADWLARFHRQTRVSPVWSGRLGGPRHRPAGGVPCSARDVAGGACDSSTASVDGRARPRRGEPSHRSGAQRLWAVEHSSRGRQNHGDRLGAWGR